MHRWDSRANPPPEGVPPVLGSGRSGSWARDQVRRGTWRRSSRGFYVPVNAPDSPSQRIAEAAARLPTYGAIGGWAAAYWRGARFLDGRHGLDPQGGGSASARLHRAPVLLCVGDGTGHIRPSPGVQLSRARLTAEDVTVVRGLAVTTAVRTAFDGARLAPSLVEAVVFLDMMMAAGLLTLDELAAYLPAHRPAWKGVGQARGAWSLADPASKSPPETRLRMLWIREAGLPRPLVNRAVFSLDGALIGIPDLLDVESATVGEYDGEEHRDLRNHTADNAREETFEEHGLVVARVTSIDLGRTGPTVQRLNRAWRRGMGRDRARDRWTLCQPDWYRQRTR